MGRQVVPASWVHDTRVADEECRRRFLASPDAAGSLCSPAERRAVLVVTTATSGGCSSPDRGILLAAGIYGQYLYVDMAADVVLAKLSSLPDPLDLEVSADTLAAFAAVTERLAGGED